MDSNDHDTDQVQGARFSVAANATTRIVTCSGELDVASYEECGTALLAGDERAIVLDLSATTFMDCAGYRAIAGWRGHVRGGRRSLTVRGAVGEPAYLLHLIDKLEREHAERGSGCLATGTENGTAEFGR